MGNKKALVKTTPPRPLHVYSTTVGQSLFLSRSLYGELICMMLYSHNKARWCIHRAQPHYLVVFCYLLPSFHPPAFCISASSALLLLWESSGPLANDEGWQQKAPEFWASWKRVHQRQRSEQASLKTSFKRTQHLLSEILDKNLESRPWVMNKKKTLSTPHLAFQFVRRGEFWIRMLLIFTDFHVSHCNMNTFNLGEKITPEPQNNVS